MRFNFLLLSLVTALTMRYAAGCSTGKIADANLVHGGIQRTYKLYIPLLYDGREQVPLLINLHGYTSTAEEQLYYGDFRAIADTANFIVVCPQGTVYEGQTHWNTGGWTPNSTVDDLGFVAALIDKLASEYKIDPKRIYATGMSNGGEMSYLLACKLGDKIAAIASVGGAMTPETFGACNPAHAMPVLHIHGTQDDVVPYNGDATATGIMKGLGYWVNFNACAALPTQAAVPNISPNDGSTVEHFTYQGDKANVEHFKVNGGGHAWPGAAYDLPGTNQDFNASLEIWKFLCRYDLDGLR